MNRQTLTSACSILSFIMIVGILGTESFAEEKLDLKFRPKPGQKYAVRINTQDKISQTVMGQQQNINHTKTTGLGFEVKEVDTNGITLIKITYRNLKEKTDSTAGQFEYDSTDPCTAVGNPLAPTYATLMGQSFTIKVSPKGQIIEIIGLDEMFSRMAEKIVKADDEMLSKAPTTACEKKEDSKSTAAGKAQEKESAEERAKRRIDSINKQYGSKEKRIEAVKEMVKKMPMFGEDQIKNMLSDMIMVFPDQSLAIGDTWTDKVKICMKTREINGTYRLKGSEEETIFIDLNAKRTPEEEAFPWVNDEGREKHFKLIGSCQGSIEIDEQSGWLMRSKVNMRFTTEPVIVKAGESEMTKPTLEEELIIVEPMGSEATAKAITQMKVWGEVVNGLRAAVEFVPEKEFCSLGEEINGEVLGEKIGTHFHIQNVSAKTVNKFQKVGQGMTGHGILQDVEGNRLPFGEFSWGMEWRPDYSQVLRPNEFFTFDGPEIDIRGYNKYGNTGRMGGSIIYCKPGQYSIRFNLTFDTGLILEPGKRELVIKAASKSDKDADVQVEVEKR